MSEMYPDTIELLPNAAKALCDLVCHVGTQNVSMEAMAWLALVCRELPDTARYFPYGKWATIQHLEAQLERAAKFAACDITERIS